MKGYGRGEIVIMIEFEEYLRRYCMPTRVKDNEYYRIVEEEERDIE